MQSDTGCCDTAFTFQGTSIANPCQQQHSFEGDGCNKEHHPESCQTNDPHALHHFGLNRRHAGSAVGCPMAPEPQLLPTLPVGGADADCLIGLLDANGGGTHHVPVLPPFQSHSLQMTPSRHSALSFLNESWNQGPLLSLSGTQVHQIDRRATQIYEEARVADCVHFGVPAAQIRHGKPTKSEPNDRDASKFVLSMSLPSDQSCLTVYQMLLRQSLEYFAATRQDAEARVRGRKQKIQVGQIGVRCRYCSHLPVQSRGKGACYFPKTLINVYQAAQNIAGAHFCMGKFCCPFVPKGVSLEIDLQKLKRDASKAGRSYWVDACKDMEVFEEDGALWLPGYRNRSAEEVNNSTASSHH